ncbi:MAG: Dihydroxyacetone phosphatase [Anaerolineae bacterium]|nr:Dihydroxyacetone phosphatase [Anaerolineae bacterium]
MSTPKKTYLIDMDGVLVHGQRPIPGAIEFINRLREGGHKFLVLTNNPRYTVTDLQHRLQTIGFDLESNNIYSSALATAAFVQSQKPGGKAYVIGDTGLYQALADVGYTLTEYNPDYVILGETETYPFEKLTRATQLISSGVPFIATNPDPNGPTESGVVPACGAVASLLEKATGYKPYFVGKPNPLMMRSALRFLNEHSENAVMVGDRMDTDVKIGLESGLQTILVFTGMTTPELIGKFPYRPNQVFDSVADIIP